MPGIEFHAQFIESLLNNTPLKRLGEITGMTAGILLGLISFFVVVLARLYIVIIYYLIYPFLLLFTGWYLHAGWGILIPLYLWILLGWSLPLIGGSVYRYFIVDSKRRFLSNAFGHYIAPEVVASLSNNPEELIL